MIYRSDLDVLRAIAVIAVLIFHLDAGFLPGGFFGVDIFFVISGYLITQIYMREHTLSPKSYVYFMLKRIRRLWPGMITAVLLSTVLAYFFLLPDVMRDFCQSIVASLLFLSNLLFYSESGYFDTSASMKPLLHTWSLSLEMQFYILFPILIYALGRFFSLGRSIVIMAALSFLAAIWLGFVNRDLNFYMIPGRLWEFCLGAALAAYPSLTPARKWQIPLAVLGWAAIIASFVFLKEGAYHPGFPTLLPCAGAALLIACEQSGDLLSRIPQIRKGLSYIGRISYHLYLYHFPLIVFTLYAGQKDLQAAQMLAILAATFILAALSYSLIETPVRRTRNPRLLFKFAALGVVLCIGLSGFGLAGYLKDGLPGRFPQLPGNMLGGVLSHMHPRHQDCMDLDPEGYPSNLCTFPPSAQKADTLLWGSSHAMMYLPALEPLYQNSEAGLITAGMSGCPPTVRKFLPETTLQDRKCGLHNRKILDILQENPDIHTVLLGLFWQEDFEQHGQALIDDLLATIQALQKQGKRVILIGSLPTFDFDVPLRLAHRLIYKTNAPIGMDAAEFQRQTGAIDEAISALIKRTGACYIDVADILCTETFCYAAKGDTLLYADDHHLSVEGAHLVGKAFSGIREKENLKRRQR